MNILLISLPEKNKDMKLEATEVLPLALYSLSSVLKCQGYEVSIIDPCEFVYLDEKENAETTCVTLIEECLEEGYDIANYAQTECQFRYCGTAIPFLTVRSTAR